MRWDLQEILGLDLNDWLRGERDWRDLWELIDGLRHRQGSRYRSAKLTDPDIVEMLATAELDENPEIPIEGFGPIDARLANLEDRLTQILYAVSRADSSMAPLTPRPTLPHEQRRQEIRRGRLRALESQLTGGENA
ncbi:hypothetical protein [Nocardia otitidiscaviarum]|uniref:hypothetical protein n=1 Tax=Nocardia otitidiscaviarum TaxID=1823 RepID=UPI0004A74AEE|nr:hypothetical protein [Nocardia otitidiscaviarum]